MGYEANPPTSQSPSPSAGPYMHTAECSRHSARQVEHQKKARPLIPGAAATQPKNVIAQLQRAHVNVYEQM